jgi:nitroreductase
MQFTKPVTQLVAERFSCRTYAQSPIPERSRELLSARADAVHDGPLGTNLRFTLVAATEQDPTALRNLGTYGFVRNPAAFLVGAASPAENYLEDYGYCMEQLILAATDLGLGTCWLGGTFTRSSFSRAVGANRNEHVPAVASVGMIEDLEKAQNGMIRRRAGGVGRLQWEQLFFDGKFGAPLSAEAAGPYAASLEMVRLAPSASNKQPWRVVREGTALHVFLSRTPGYRGSVVGRLLKLEDIQKVDIGIAMCHFELAARERGLTGSWVVRPPQIEVPGSSIEYAVSWQG